MESLAKEYTPLIGKKCFFEKKGQIFLRPILLTFQRVLFFLGPKISSAFKKEITKEGKVQSALITRQFPINIKVNNRKETVAYLDLYSRQDILYLKMKDEFFLTLIKLLSEFCLFTIFVFHFLKRTLKIPLQEMTTQLQSLKPQELTQMTLTDSPINELNVFEGDFSIKMIFKDCQR